MADARDRSGGWAALAALAVVVVAVGAWWLGPGSGDAVRERSDAVAASVTATVDTTSGLPLVDEADLPAQATYVLAAIDRGGPYRYRCCDDVVFRNDEGVLPDERRGYYREYTVTTPGSSDRGPRRIVAGSGGELYYTDDHYRSFERIRR